MRIFRLMLIIITTKTRGNGAEKNWIRIQGMSAERHPKIMGKREAPVVWMGERRESEISMSKVRKIEN